MAILPRDKTVVQANLLPQNEALEDRLGAIFGITLVTILSTMQQNTEHTVWQSGWTFCLALCGVTIGLQLIWTLPAVLIRQGGSGYLLVYVASLVLFAAPLLAAEIWLGREGRNNPVHAIKLLQIRSGLSRWWRVVGLLNVIVSILVLSYLVVIGSWALAFGLESANNSFILKDADFLVQHLRDFLEDGNQVVSWLSLFLLLTVLVSAFGVDRGVGFALRLLIPLAIIILLVLIARNVAVGAFDGAAVSSLLSTNTPLSWDGGWSAVTLAFFTISVGMGAAMSLAAYMPPSQRISTAVAGVVLITLFVAALACSAILPLLFHANVEIAEGAPLMFLNLPLAFGSSVHGDYYGALFFGLVTLFAFSSAIVLLEPIVSWLQRALIVPRYIAACAGGGLVWLVCVTVGLSFNEWSEIRLFGYFTPFRLLESLTAHLIVPIVAILNACLAASLLGSPSYASSGFAPLRLLGRLHLAYLSPVLIAGVIWFSLNNKFLF